MEARLRGQVGPDVLVALDAQGSLVDVPQPFAWQAPQSASAVAWASITGPGITSFSRSVASAAAASRIDPIAANPREAANRRHCRSVQVDGKNVHRRRCEQ